MTRWIVSFALVLFFLCVLYYLVRLRSIPEDDIKERWHDHADGRARRRHPAPGHQTPASHAPGSTTRATNSPERT
jgi:hypothetical protein